MTQQAQAEALSAIIHDLRTSHSRTSQGVWGKGETTHHTVAKRGAGAPYRVAEFRHADDAQFCDTAHALVPKLIEEAERLHARVQELEAERKPLTDEDLYDVIRSCDVDLLRLAEQWADNKIHRYQFCSQAEGIVNAAVRRAERAHGIEAKE